MGAAPGRIPNTQLRRERELRGWSQERVAEELGTNKFMISRWEGGVKTPSPHFREQLCLLFGKTAEELGFIPSQTYGQETAETRLIWHVPLRRTPFFTGRKADLAQLASAFEISGSADLSQAISGLGGVGKTSLALEYAYRSRHLYQAVLWVGADSHDYLLTNLAGLAGVLGLPEQYETNQNRMVAAVQNWLQGHPNWLLIVDNLVDLRLGEEALPSGPGRLLVTTQAHALGFIARKLDLAPLPPEEGMLLLLRRARVLSLDAPLSQAPPDAQELAQAIAIHLEGLPLALDQAGSYVEETNCGLEGYLRRLETHQGALLQRRGQMVAGHPASVTTTLLLNIAQVRATTPEAAELLECCAFLHPDAIPEELFTQGEGAQEPGLAVTGVNSITLDAMLETLSHFSILLRDPHTQTLRLHRLVQSVVKEQIPLEQQHIWVERIVRMVHDTLPEVGLPSWSDFVRYFPQAFRGCELIAAWNLRAPEARHLLVKTGAHLREQARYPEAERLLKQALVLHRQVFGRKHPETAHVFYHLALLYQDLGRYRRAQWLASGALALQEQTLGTKHPQVAFTLISLAHIRVFQGAYDQAEPLAHRALSILEHHAEPIHPSLAECLYVLGEIYQKRGDYNQALIFHQRALHLAQRIYGPTHRLVANNLNSLANIYNLRRDYEQAENYYQQAVSIAKQTLPPDHPDLITTLLNLSHLYERTYKYTKALPLAQCVCELYGQVLGTEHPLIAFGLDLLARVNLGLGNVGEAEHLGQRALSLRRQLLGSGHPLTATSMRTLARILQKQGRIREAELLFQQALAIHEQALGAEHLRVAESLDQYAQFLRQTRRENKAMALEVRAQVIRNRYLPIDQSEGKQESPTGVVIGSPNEPITVRENTATPLSAFTPTQWFLLHGRALCEAFASVPDHRTASGRRHALPAILALATAAMLAGASTLHAIAVWGREQPPEVAQALGFPEGQTPAFSTLHAVFATLDIPAFEVALATWAQRTFGSGAEQVGRERNPRETRSGRELPGVWLLREYTGSMG